MPMKRIDRLLSEWPVLGGALICAAVCFHVPGPCLVEHSFLQKTATFAATAVNSRSSINHFEVDIAQDGVTLPVQNKTVELDRKPFELRMQLVKPCFLWINASFEPGLYNLSQRGGSLHAIFTPGHIGADFDKNPHRQIFISPGLPRRKADYWKIVHNNYFVSGRRHRCDVARKLAGGCFCKRTIASLWRKKEKIALERLRSQLLYLVFYKARCDSTGNRCTEQKRSELVLRFRKAR